MFPAHPFCTHRAGHVARVAHEVDVASVRPQEPEPVEVAVHRRADVRLAAGGRLLLAQEVVHERPIAERPVDRVVRPATVAIHSR